MDYKTLSEVNIDELKEEDIDKAIERAKEIKKKREKLEELKSLSESGVKLPPIDNSNINNNNISSLPKSLRMSGNFSSSSFNSTSGSLNINSTVSNDNLDKLKLIQMISLNDQSSLKLDSTSVSNVLQHKRCVESYLKSKSLLFTIVDQSIASPEDSPFGAVVPEAKAAVYIFISNHWS